MTESARVLLAAEALVDRGFLAYESDDRLCDLRVEGRGFRYVAKFWECVGALVCDADGAARRSPLDGAPDMTEAQLRVAVEWAAVGAPLEWARGEARSALGAFLRRIVPRPWGDTRRSSPEPLQSPLVGTGTAGTLKA